MRDRLIELLRQISCYYVDCRGISCSECQNVFIQDENIEGITDHLLANGVIVLPYKVGDMVYRRSTGNITEYTITNISISDKRLWVLCCNYNSAFWTQDIGKTVFLTREEAEQALLKS